MKNELIDTPHLGPEWAIREGTIGKMLENDWYFLNCATDLYPSPLCRVYTEGDKGQEALRALERIFDEDCKGCNHSLIQIFGEATSMMTQWESYAHLERALMRKDVIDLLAQFLANMEVIRTSIEGENFKEYIKKQISKRTSTKKPYANTHSVRQFVVVNGGEIKLKTEKIGEEGEFEITIKSRVNVVEEPVIFEG